MIEQIFELVMNFAVLSVVAVGGGSSILTAVHHLATDPHGGHAAWLTNQQFRDVYGLGQVAPGPGMLYVSVIGYKVAGIPGAVAATVAMFLPACLITYFAGRSWDRYSESPWLKSIKAGLAPVTVGLMLSGTLSVARIAADQVPTAAMAVIVTIVLMRTRISATPLVLVCGALGWLLLR